VPGNVVDAELPQGIDVYVGELIDTGLLDEMQVEVVNALRGRGVIDPATRLIPELYTTFAELVTVDDSYYGFRIAAPKHEWPFYAREDPTWQPTAVTPLTERVPIAQVDFRNPVDQFVSQYVRLTGIGNGLANAVRLSGVCLLSPAVSLGATNAFNGDKILHLAHGLRVTAGESLGLGIELAHGKGLGSFECRPINTATELAPVPQGRSA
jgi:hypothetical protein